MQISVIDVGKRSAGCSKNYLIRIAIDHDNVILVDRAKIGSVGRLVNNYTTLVAVPVDRSSLAYLFI